MANEPIEILTLAASEKGTYAITGIQFLDEDDEIVTPIATTVKWCLTTKAGVVINNKQNITIISAASMNIVLSGDDLAVSGAPDKTFIANGVETKQYQRHVAIQGAINSTLGEALPVTKEFIFFIENIVCL